MIRLCLRTSLHQGLDAVPALEQVSTKFSKTKQHMSGNVNKQTVPALSFTIDIYSTCPCIWTSHTCWNCSPFTRTYCRNPRIHGSIIPTSTCITYAVAYSVGHSPLHGSAVNLELLVPPHSSHSSGLLVSFLVFEFSSCHPNPIHFPLLASS